MPGPLSSLYNVATTPLMPKSWTDAVSQAAQPGLDTSPAMARLKGFGAGALEGLRGLTSPLQIAGMASMGMGAPASAVAEGAESVGPMMQLMEEAPAVRQMMPTGGDVDALSGLLKYNLAKIPTSSKLTQAAAPVATSMSDMLHPGTQNMMEKMYQQANPVFEALKRAGQFAGDRTTMAPPIK